jgi:hypothetical protein
LTDVRDDVIMTSERQSHDGKGGGIMESTIHRELTQLKVQDLLREAERTRRVRRTPRTRRPERDGGSAA